MSLEGILKLLCKQWFRRLTSGHNYVFLRLLPTQRCPYKIIRNEGLWYLNKTWICHSFLKEGGGHWLFQLSFLGKEEGGNLKYAWCHSFYRFFFGGHPLISIPYNIAGLSCVKHGYSLGSDWDLSNPNLTKVWLDMKTTVHTTQTN